jgi:hypothetical protein
MRRKVIPVIKTKSKINWGNIKNDKASDIMKHYGLSERQMQQEVRAHVSDCSQKEINKIDHIMYGKKD